MQMKLALLAALGAVCQAFVPLSHQTVRTTALQASNADELVPLKKGSTVALLTPFNEQTGAIDYNELRKLLRYHLNSGTRNLCILGTTGEASVLTMKERELVLRTAVEEVKGKMSILVGTGTVNPAATLEMTQQAADVGCDAALVVTPYYVKPPQRALIQHMVSIADGPLPVMIYNVPGRTAVNMLDESIALAAQHSNVVALKDATGDLGRIEHLKRLVDDDFLILSGDDGTTLDFMQRGGDGCISVTANVAAAEMAQMTALALSGQYQAAADINNRLLRLHDNLFCEANPIPVKWAAKRLGLIQSAYCRPPLCEMDLMYARDIEDALAQAGNLQLTTPMFTPAKMQYNHTIA